MPALPGHLAIGRSNLGGPVTGGYILFPFGPFTVAASQTDLIQAAFIAPCDLRLERISINARVSAAADVVKFMSNTPAGGISVTNATSLMNVASITPGGTSISGYVAPSGETDGGFTATLSTTTSSSASTAVRTLVAGTRVFAAITTDATAGGMVDVNIYFYCALLGHANVNADND